MKSRHGLTGQEGFSLIEVLVAALILGIAIVGMTMLLSRGQMAVVAQGDTRIALHLAEQKIERLRGLGFSNARVADASGLAGHNPANGTADTDGCGSTAFNNEPCYNEVGDSTLPACATLSTTASQDEACYNRVLLAGVGQQSTTTQLDTQRFTRITCVRWVRDDNPELPADAVDPDEPPSTWTCPSCTPGDLATDPGNCGPTGTTSCCTRQTKRIRVAVFPRLLGSPTAEEGRDPNRVTLELVLTPTAKP